jgi:hypothetical protein
MIDGQEAGVVGADLVGEGGKVVRGGELGEGRAVEMEGKTAGNAAIFRYGGEAAPGFGEPMDFIETEGGDTNPIPSPSP